MPSPLLAEIHEPLGIITLNRPEALHALNHEMCEAMIKALLDWENNSEVQAVWIQHAPGSRGFCAGGDIRMLAKSGQKDGKKARAFFHTEYQLNHALHCYPKPIIAAMDGVTMGGGVGISVHGPFRIATEKTLFAMPETGIGLFPDVGGGWFLPRLAGFIGRWLALTGSRLRAADCIGSGLATHFIRQSDLQDCKNALSQKFVETSGQRPAAMVVEEVLEQFQGMPAADQKVMLTPENLACIHQHFAHNHAEAIFQSLAKDESDFAQEQLLAMKSKSPQSVKIALAQIIRGKRMQNFEEVMQMEYRLGGHIVTLPEFHEGVRAVIIDKDHQPQWNPPEIGEVDDEWVDALFDPLSENEEWRPLPQTANWLGPR